MYAAPPFESADEAVVVVGRIGPPLTGTPSTGTKSGPSSAVMWASSCAILGEYGR